MNTTMGCITVFSQNAYVEILSCNVMGVGGGGLWEVIRIR